MWTERKSDGYNRLSPEFLWRAHRFDGDMDIYQSQPDSLYPGPIRARVLCQYGSRIALQSTPSLSKKRYAATASHQPLQACGTLIVGCTASRSINILARLFRRALPRSSCPNSSRVQFVDLFPNCATQKQEARVNAMSRQFPKTLPSH